MLVEDEKITYRVVTIGSSSVGKTSIINRFLHEKFNEQEQNTVGALYESFTETRNGQEMEIQIWDTAGQEQYRSLTNVYFRGAAAALLVFDLTNTNSYGQLGDWLQSFYNSNDSKTIVFVVGNKCDLEKDRRIPTADAQDWAKTNGCFYIETSAAEGENIQELFTQLVDELAKSTAGDGPMVLSTQKMRLRAPESKDEKGCC